MLESIKDDGTGGTSDQNNREYSGNFNKSGTGVVDEKQETFRIHGKEMFPLKELLLTIVTQVVLAKRMIKQLHGNSHHQSRTLVLQRERNMS